MKLSEITGWLNRELEPGKFDDVSNNGLQIAREGFEISRVAFGVDASVAFLEKAAAAGAQLCVVHHGISWGGGIRRLTGSDYAVVKTALARNLAVYASHLPLDANERHGNNWELARLLNLSSVKPAFSYHGNVIGVTGRALESGNFKVGATWIDLEKDQRVGVCSGGAGEFAVEAKALGCDLYLTGEASWGDVVAAENVGMKMVCAGHYATETFGVSALARAMARELDVEAVTLLRKGAGGELGW